MQKINLKTKKIIIFTLLLIVTALIVIKFKSSLDQDIVIITPTIRQSDSFKIDSFKNMTTELAFKSKKLLDTTVVLSFNDLSNKYNYKITDQYYCVNSQWDYDSVSRVINIFNKKDSIVQEIHPNLRMSPWYFHMNEVHLRLSRSYITMKNANYKDMDNYSGEIVVADLNFDGLEDFATPIDQGVDNGPHYAFYIQNKNYRFEINNYLTDNVIWFPEKINNSLMTFTNMIPCTIYGLNYNTFKYNSASNKWSKIEDYTIDIRTGKLMKMD